MTLLTKNTIKWRQALFAACLIGNCAVFSASAQDTVKYVGSTLSNVDYHSGQLSPAVGVHNIQVFRANREHPELAGGMNWTYNHQPMLAYWNNTYFLEFLSDPVGEHIPPGQTFLVTSKDGYNWTSPKSVFPVFKLPDGYRKEGVEGVAKDLYAVMHQRMGFFVAKNGKLLVLGYYGIAMDAKDDPNDGKGIGRVVREIKKDGTYGPIYYIRNNKSWKPIKGDYPQFTKSKDKGFVAACNELLGTPLVVQQWVEEADRDDPLIRLQRPIKAFSYYHLNNGKVVGLWKHALTSVSDDNGKTWQYNPLRAPGFVNSNAKIWGQRTSDGRYATVYNPSEFRWPLAVSTSDDGLTYKDLLLVNGEISSMRYGGNYKSYGPQYVRGIAEGNGIIPDKNMWVGYSVNKEDIWVAKIPVPVRSKVTEQANEDFATLNPQTALNLWNINSGLWASVKIEKASDGKNSLTLRDKDPYDFAKAERVIPASAHGTVEFSVVPQQNDNGLLHIELQDSRGTGAVRLIFDHDGVLKYKAGYRDQGVTKYESGKEYKIKIDYNTATRSCVISVNGESKGTRIFFAPIHTVERVMFRTGIVRRFPDADTPTDQSYDLKDPGTPVKEAVFNIRSFKSSI